MKKVILLITVILILSGCEKKHDAYKPKESSGFEYVAKAPSGKLSPVFDSEKETKDYIEQHTKDFPSGTIIMRR